MKVRRLLTVTLVVVVSCGVLLATPPVTADAGTPRAAVPFELALVEGGGVLQLRGAEPYEITTPTSVSGLIDDTSGAISGGSFATPTVSFEQQITSPVVATVYIDATFSQVSAGNLAGSVDADGNVVAQVGLSVALHIEVGRAPTLLTANCTAVPVQLNLRSTAPYDPDTGLVTVADADFTVPPAAIVEGCPDIVADAINEQLQGGGHSLTLTLQGQVPLPPQPGDPSTTTLTVEPAGSTRIGDPVTLTATVAPGPDAEATDVPAGLVDFLDGTRVIDTATLDDAGKATITTSTLSAGPRRLAAKYRGGDGVYRGSTSVVTVFNVIANPALSWDLPSAVQIAGDAADFDLTVRNTGFGGDIANARLDVTIRRAVGTAAIGPVSGQPRIILSTVDDDVATQVDLVAAGSGGNQTLSGSIGGANGFPLDAGETFTQGLRLELPPNGTVSPTACGTTNRLCPGPFTVTVELVVVDPDDGTEQAVLLTDSGRFTATEAVRRTPTIVAGRAPNPFIPGDTGELPVVPHTVRQGNNISLNQLNVNPTVTGVRPSGFIEFQLDGKPIPARRTEDDAAFGYRDKLEVLTPTGGLFNAPVSVPIPPDTEPGTKTITVRYLGDLLFLPVTQTFTFEVAPSAGPPLECIQPGIFVSNLVMGANLVLQAGLPAVAAKGTQIPFGHLNAALLFDRGQSAHLLSQLREVESLFESASVGLSPVGSITTSGVSLANDTQMNVAGDPDLRLTFDDLSLSITVEGEPGEVVPVTLEEIAVTHGTTFGGGLVATLSCRPVGGPVVVGEIVVAGTSLEVSPTGSARAGRPVTLTATSAPSGPGGVVEFLDGTQTIGVVPVVNGQAVLTVDDLPQGTRNLTARSYPGLSIPSTASETVELTILQAHECAAFAQEGNAAVVRLVYMELLRRCPDQVGFDYWVDRLDNGASPEVFARSIARTPEAVGVVVNDGYQTMLGRPADAEGRTFWTGRLQGHGRYDQLLADLAASDEFWTKAGSSNEGFVTRVYDRLLHRAPDQAGLDYWVGRLDAGASRRVLVLTLANLDEPLGVLVVQSYDEILSRNPFTGERATGIEFLRATGDRSGLYAELIGRPEFSQRAQGFPNPED